MHSSHVHRDNVYQTNGYLVLTTRHIEYLTKSYTSALLTSTQQFKSGRYEIRTSLPANRKTISFFQSLNQNDAYFDESGTVNILTYLGDQADSIVQGFHYANRSETIDMDNFPRRLMKPDLRDFHLYGVEWSERKIRFFFDDLYTETVQLTKSKGLKQPRLIMLAHNVISIENESFSELNWKCPALLVDYVRVYQQVIISDSNNLTLCKSYSQNEEQEKVNQICHKAMDEVEGVQSIWDKLRRNWKILLIVSLILLFALLIIYLAHKISLNQRKQAKSEESHYETIPYGSENQQNEDDKNRHTSYLDLQDKFPPSPQRNSYLELHDKYPTTEMRHSYLDLHDKFFPSDQSKADDKEKFNSYLKLHDQLQVIKRFGMIREIQK